MVAWLKLFFHLKRICNLRHYRAVIKSGLFDHAWYSENYPGMFSRYAPVAHYLLIGGVRGNDPNLTCSGPGSARSDVDASARGDPLAHYAKLERAKGRRYLKAIWGRVQAPRPDMVVGFAIAGTQKGGTTALAKYLGTNREICMPTVKEVHFFDDENYFKNRRPDYLLYHAFFDPKASHKIIGDVTPRYMYWHDAAMRMWHYNPSMKIIIILRNPIERAYAHWNMERHMNREKLSFLEAIQSERTRCRNALPFQHPVFSYIDRGYYSEQLRRIWTYFPRSQTIILRNEDLKDKPSETMEITCRFLGVGCPRDVRKEFVHCTPYSKPMSDEERAYLRDVYEYEIRNLERILGWDCSSWLN